jgi:hypothetical protein
MNNDELRYPIGKFAPQESYTAEEVKSNITRIEKLPAELEKLVNTLTTKQLDTPYRDGGWTGRQVIHHMADSHMNAFIRFKWTLTEATPVIKVYDEKAWAETLETTLDPAISISIVKALHIKWVALLRLLKAEDLRKEFIHPESKKNISLARLVALYAWHGEHHLGHIKIVAKKP